MSYYTSPPHQVREFLIVLLTITILALIFTGCATLTEEERYERDDAIIQSQAEFDRKFHACKAAGGRVVIKRRSAGRIPKPYTRYEMETASCTF